LKWDIFTGRKKEQKGKPKDEVDLLIEGIERFAPREYRSEREGYYYNYRILGLYAKPLVCLLETLTQKERLKAGEAGFIREVYLRLKDFYDPKDRLSRAEAVKETGLTRKFREIFLLFYGQKQAPLEDMEQFLEDIQR